MSVTEDCPQIMSFLCFAYTLTATMVDCLRTLSVCGVWTFIPTMFAILRVITSLTVASSLCRSRAVTVSDDLYTAKFIWTAPIARSLQNSGTYDVQHVSPMYQPSLLYLQMSKYIYKVKDEFVVLQHDVLAIS